jgi:V/A-type H+-transporting ATPase subunit C
MNKLNSPALSAKAKSMYGNRLKEKDYEELLQKNSVPDIAAYLKTETEYKSTMKDIYEHRIHRGELEELIRQNMFEKIEKLLKFSQLLNNKFYRMHIIKREIEVILLALRFIIPDRLEDAEMYDNMIKDLPIILSDYFSFEMHSFSNIKNYDDILEILTDTPYYDIILPFRVVGEEKVDFTGIERQLYSYYYEYVFSTVEATFSGKQRKELIDIYRTQIELLNIIKIYRFKKFFKVTNEQILNSMVTNHSRMSTNFIKELIEQPTAEDVLRKLQDSKYHLYTDSKDYTYIEYYADKIKYNIANRYIHFSISTPVVFTAYSILLDIEVTNLINIIEAIRYETPRYEVENLLIY